MKIGIDAMGGDNAPDVVIEGASLAKKELGNHVDIVLTGNQKQLQQIITEKGIDNNTFEIAHTEKMVEMGENPVKAMSLKPDSSIGVGFKLLEKGEIEGFASAGNTGAMMIGAMYSIKSIPGIIRPVITSPVPLESGNYKILMDVGINPDCKPDVLYQWAMLGSLYAENIFNINNPKIGLLNIGAEEEKGNLLTKNTYQLMKGSKDFNFYGNIEGNQLFEENAADVIVCDGFVGNVVLKLAEAFYSLTEKKNIKDDYFDKFNFENYGGTPILGVNKSVIIGHGISNKHAIKNMILLTHDVIINKLTEKIKKVFD